MPDPKPSAMPTPEEVAKELIRPLRESAIYAIQSLKLLAFDEATGSGRTVYEAQITSINARCDNLQRDIADAIRARDAAWAARLGDKYDAGRESVLSETQPYIDARHETHTFREYAAGQPCEKRVQEHDEGGSLMQKQKVFEYVVLYHPKSKKDKDGNEVNGKSKLLADVTRALAVDEKEVGIMAARQIPEEYLDKLEQVEIVIRPF